MTPDELFQIKKEIKRAKRRDQAPEEANLGMTSLMDIVSIIVVYLLKSYASDPVLITPIAEQKIPMSKMDAPIKEGVAIYVSSRELIFNEEQLATLKEGEFDANVVQGHVITPLYEKLEEETEKSKAVFEDRGEEWVGHIILIGDEALKFSAIVDVMYTAGRLNYSEYSFCIIQKG
ncbi:biopolymer transporter ExbD [Pseudenhygromyxa sp. WMMC2535]|uniref:biopolymer transporter ExbD n=1 Tax=Pseudenhygromyxa sp. WMMC2535 TaxID=2712867 RepID=UPI00155632C2|nr:biopolymer transporter ExbD [Pseudenhygromyxa sp. WMMC2535]NVB39092.1 biopolymer transporter ExbD [Pseudenhygromyxa sp. WMMC2535]